MEIGVLAGDPFKEFGDLRMRPQRLGGGVAAFQLLVAERRVDRAVWTGTVSRPPRLLVPLHPASERAFAQETGGLFLPR